MSHPDSLICGTVSSDPTTLPWPLITTPVAFTQSLISWWSRDPRRLSFPHTGHPSKDEQRWELAGEPVYWGEAGALAESPISKNRGWFILVPDPESKRKGLGFGQKATGLSFSFTRERKEEKQASSADRQPNYFTICGKVPILTPEKWLMKTRREDTRPYPQKAGTVTELVGKYLVLRAWRLLLETERREYLLLVAWNRSHRQNYLQIPKIKEEWCYIYYKSVWEQRAENVLTFKIWTFIRSSGTHSHKFFFQFIFISSKKHM